MKPIRLNSIHLSRRHSLCAAASLVCSGAWPALAGANTPSSSPTPALPRARVEAVTETLWGQSVTDPYRWMENPKDAQWEPFMRGQDAHARHRLAALPGRAAMGRRVNALSSGMAVAYGVQPVQGRVFYQVRPVGADNFKLAMRQGEAGRERILIDPTRLKGPGGVHVSLDWWVASPDGRRVVYGLSEAGSEDSVLHVMEVDTGTVLPLRIPGTQYAGPAWLPDSSGFFYWRLAEGAQLGTPDYYRRSRLLFHRVGTDSKADLLVMQRGLHASVEVDIDEFPGIGTPNVGEHLVLGLFGGVRRQNPLFVARTADVLAGKPQWQQVCTVEDEVTGYAFDAQTLYLVSTKGAENARLLAVPLANPAIANAKVVVAESAQVLEGITLAKDGVYLRQMDGGYSRVRKLLPDGQLQEVPLPAQGSVSSLSGDAREPGVWFDITGWLTPFSVARHEPQKRRSRFVRLTPPAKLDLSGYEALRLEVKVRDGTTVPLSLVARKGLKRDGRNPVLIDAYGAYQISSAPYFSTRSLAFLEQGGVLATAHVRGGGEFGKRWWKAGQMLNKPNTWRDLIDCCEHLVKTGWASPSTLTIQGGSAGGITVGRALTERPELFAGVISNVGVSNPLRAEVEQNGPPNVDEFGSVKTEDGFKGLLAMDAYQAVRDGTPYPAVLLTVGMTDPRVSAWHGAKMAARLQAATSSRNPVLLRVDFDAGHGLGSTRAQIDALRADEFSFALWCARRG